MIKNFNWQLYHQSFYQRYLSQSRSLFVKINTYYSHDKEDTFLFRSYVCVHVWYRDRDAKKETELNVHVGLWEGT